MLDDELLLSMTSSHFITNKHSGGRAMLYEGTRSHMQAFLPVGIGTSHTTGLPHSDMSNHNITMSDAVRLLIGTILGSQGAQKWDKLCEVHDGFVSIYIVDKANCMRGSKAQSLDICCLIWLRFFMHSWDMLSIFVLTVSIAHVSQRHLYLRSVSCCCCCCCYHAMPPAPSFHLCNSPAARAIGIKTKLTDTDGKNPTRPCTPSHTPP